MFRSVLAAQLFPSTAGQGTLLPEEGATEVTDKILMEVRAHCSGVAWQEHKFYAPL